MRASRCARQNRSRPKFVSFRKSVVRSSLLRHATFQDRGSGDTTKLEYARNEDRRIAEFVKGVDVLVMDSQYDRQEYPEHRGWGHGCIDDVVRFALKSRVKRLFLFHHDPDHDDAKIDSMVTYARNMVSAEKGALQVEAAREGSVVQLPAGKS